MKRNIGVILYGPPASGKDTITRALVALDNRYAHYQRLKIGSGRTSGYRRITLTELANLRRADRIIWENDRYGATYVVERASLTELTEVSIPVIHLGQVEAVAAIQKAMPDVNWKIIYIWCPRDVATRRLHKRQTGDVAARLRAWDETSPLANSDLSINTAITSPTEAARLIHVEVESN